MECPIAPPQQLNGLRVIAQPRLLPDVVLIAMCATTMKLNPRFLQACSQIIRESSVPVHFQFFDRPRTGVDAS